MRDMNCNSCLCRKCLDNAENNADEMCRNCDCCRENDFKYAVKSVEFCLVYRED